MKVKKSISIKVTNIQNINIAGETKIKRLMELLRNGDYGLERRKSNES